MRNFLMLTLLTLVTAGCWAADEKPVDPKSVASIAAFNQALAGQDVGAKKAALQGLSGSDDDILPLMVQALNDRQLGDLALNALRSRTGLQPPANKRLGGPGYPGYPKDDSAGSWSGWLSERTKTVEQAKLIKDLKDKEKDKDKPAVKADPTADPGDATADATKPKAPAVDTDLGSIDRVIFKTGGALLCYVLSKRTDADGNLISVRIAHTDGGGEEVLQADLISRLEEDVK